MWGCVEQPSSFSHPTACLALTLPLLLLPLPSDNPTALQCGLFSSGILLVSGEPIPLAALPHTLAARRFGFLLVEVGFAFLYLLLVSGGCVCRW